MGIDEKAEFELDLWVGEKFGIPYRLTTYNNESMIEFAKFYLKNTVEQITDKELIETMHINDYHSYKRRSAFIKGFNSLRNKLLSNEKQ